jgi:DNA-binding MarR family transcriptional regulator
MSKRVSPDDTLDILLLLRRTTDVLRRLRQKELLQFGVTPEHAAVLHILNDLGGSARPMEISLWLFRKRQSVHDLIDRMEKVGLVRKTEDLKRKNGIMVVITAQGRLLNQKTSKLTTPAKIISALSISERRQLAGFLDVLLQSGQKEAGIKDTLPLRP